MSKGRTPITAGEWLEEEYPYILDGFEHLEVDKQVLGVMEQYAKIKVLEALERELKKVANSGEFYFKNVVKPKYETR